jgi:hypothetical protein
MHGMINRMEQRSNVLTGAIQLNDNGKASLVENFLQKTALPFTEEVASFCLPEKFKVPDVPFYTGLKDPLQHQENFRAHIDLHLTIEKVACGEFSLRQCPRLVQKTPPKFQ